MNSEETTEFLIRDAIAQWVHYACWVARCVTRGNWQGAQIGHYQALNNFHNAIREMP